MITLLVSLVACDLLELEREEEVAIADLPAAVVDAIEAEWPGAELLEAEREQRDRYEVEIRTASDLLLEVEIEEDGTIIDFEEEDDDDDSKEDDDE